MASASKVTKTAWIGSLVGISLLFQNCGEVNFSAVTSSLASKADEVVVGDVTPADPEALPPGTPDLGPPPPVEDEDDLAYSGLCSGLVNEPLPPLTIPADAPNREIKWAFGRIVVDVANDVDIHESVVKVLIRAANTVRLKNSVDKVQINANFVEEVKNNISSICVRADRVGLITNTAAKAKIIAKEIDEIRNTIAVVHVYGATVRKVSRSVGGICLHDGAKVLQIEDSIGFVGDCKRR